MNNPFRDLHRKNCQERNNTIYEIIIIKKPECVSGIVQGAGPNVEAGCIRSAGLSLGTTRQVTDVMQMWVIDGTQTTLKYVNTEHETRIKHCFTLNMYNGAGFLAYLETDEKRGNTATTFLLPVARGRSTLSQDERRSA